MNLMKKALTLIAAVVLIATAAFGEENPARNQTIEDLKAAFTGESTASAKYAAFAKKAADESFIRVSKLFEAASKAEAFHAANHKAVLEQLGAVAPEVVPKFEVKTTEENLQDAIGGESYEVATMYPEMLKNVNASKVTIAGISFNYAFETEKTHQILYTKALEALKAGKESSLSGQYAVCSTCGNTYDASVPNRCGLCMTSKDRFVLIA